MASDNYVPMPQRKQYVGAATDRTVAQLLRGDSNVPLKQLSPEQRLQYERAKALDQQSKGVITPEQSAQRIAKAQRAWEIEQGQRTVDIARRKGAGAKSEAVKQESIRDMAARHGVGVGTISKDGTAQVSNRSRISNNANVSNFTELQKVPRQDDTRTSYEVTLKEGEKKQDSQEIQGPVKPNYLYDVTLSEGKKDDSFTGPYGDLTYNYGRQQGTVLGDATEKSLESLDALQLQKPKDPILSSLKTIIDPVIGFSKASLATFASFGNLGTQAGAMIKDRETPLTKQIKVPDTFVGKIVGNVIEGKSKDDQIKDAFGYATTRGIPSTMGELGEIGLGGSGGLKVAAKIIPIRGAKYSQPGVKILEQGKEVTARSVGIGYGTKVKPIISKVGSKVTIGKPDVSGVSVKVEAETGKQTQRGVKLAADSSKFEQDLNKQLLPKVQGLSKDSVSRGKTIEEIIDITTSKKSDTKTAEALPEEAFSSVTKTEQPSFIGALTRAQRKIINPIGKYEGSLSQSYFVLPKFLRQAGDVDLHASTYGKAAKQIDYITPKIKADPGREFFGVTNPKTKSAKTFVKDTKGKSEKVIEILNPEEIDESGISQVVEGSTLFGKKIPSKSYKVKEGKTYGRQRQILKKGESLYSLQQTEKGLSLEPAPFRKEKDVADFYALAKSAQEVEFPKGSKEYQRLDELLTKFKKDQDFDIDEYLKKNKATPEKVTLTTEKSLIQRTPSTLSQGTAKSLSVSSPLTKSVPSVSLSSLTGKRSITSRSPSRSVSNQPRSLTGKAPSTSIRTNIPSILSRPSVTGRSPSVTGKSIIGKSISSLTGGKSLGTPKGREGKSSTVLRVSLTPAQQTMIEQKKKVAAPLFIITKDKTDKTKGFRDRDYNFLGGTRVAEVSGFRTKKSDITVGDKKTARLYREDILKTKKRYKKSDRSGSKSLLGKRSGKMLGI